MANGMLDLIGGAGEKPTVTSPAPLYGQRFVYTREILAAMSDDEVIAHYGDTACDCGPDDAATKALHREMQRRGL
jgi:hypothetical protein